MKIRFHPIYLVLAFVLIITGLGLEVVIYSSVVLLHELAHYLVARKLGYKLGKLYLLPYGVCLSYKNQCFSPQDEISIALAGPISNLILCVMFFAFWWIFPAAYSWTFFACFASFITFIFNLLPVYPLDGGRVLCGALKMTFDTKKTYLIIKIINIVFIVIFSIIFIISLFLKINFNYLIIAVIISSGLIETNFESKYELLNLKTHKRRLNKGVSVNLKAYSSSTSLYKIYASINRFKINYFIIIFDDLSEKIISEIQLEKFLIKYGAKSNFKDIFLKY